MTARCGPGELAPFYDVFARNMRDLGTPVLPRAFFERIAGIKNNRIAFLQPAEDFDVCPVVPA